MPRKTGKTHAIGGKHGATCGELLSLLNEYVDGRVDPAVCKEMESHLAECNPCRVVVDNVRQTITLYRKDKPCALPLAFRKRLHECLRAHWKTPKPRKRRVEKGRDRTTSK
jgi:anti-sigma factor RsiW